jgi:hypothetical protein
MNWAPQNCNIFACLTLQNHVSTADRLQRRGSPNCGVRQLCRRGTESSLHLLFKCRCFVMIPNSILSWLRIDWVDTVAWANLESVTDRWLGFIPANVYRRKISSFSHNVVLGKFEKGVMQGIFIRSRGTSDDNLMSKRAETDISKSHDQKAAKTCLDTCMR